MHVGHTAEHCMFTHPTWNPRRNFPNTSIANWTKARDSSGLFMFIVNLIFSRGEKKNLDEHKIVFNS